MPKHEIRRKTIIWILCSCGWEWRNGKLKGKTDDDLKIEAGMEFDKHRKAARAAGY